MKFVSVCEQLLFFVDMKAMSFGASKKDVSRTFMKVGSPIAGPLFMKDFAWYALLRFVPSWSHLLLMIPFF